MNNLWIQTDHAFATWTADLTAASTEPQRLLAFVQDVLAAGAAHRMFEVAEAGPIGYQRARDGDLGELLARTLERDDTLDLFGFTGSAMMPGRPRSSTVKTTIAHYDRGGHMTESVVTDLGALLASLEPTPGSIPDGYLTHYPAIRITGWRYEGVRTGVAVDRRPRPLPVAVYFAIHSDIWFPWVYGSAHPWADHRRMFDNRELASRHTPRLNAFLADVADAARRAGGSFGVYADETGARVLDWVSEDGVRLDRQPPDGAMPPEALSAVWE